MFQFLADQFTSQSEYLFRIMLAALCGGCIGFERSRRQKEAGIRTHVIVCLGAALIMVISKYGFFDVVIYDSIQLDASRIASNVITGISFLGAGVIFLKGNSIRGLTTSAGLFATAACGMAIGSGLYIVGLFTTVFIVSIQYFLHKYNLSSETIAATEVRIIAKDTEDIIERIKKFFADYKVEIEDYSIKRTANGFVEYDTVVKHLTPDRMNELSAIMNEIPEVTEIRCDQ